MHTDPKISCTNSVQHVFKHRKADLIRCRAGVYLPPEIYTMYERNGGRLAPAENKDYQLFQRIRGALQS